MNFVLLAKAQSGIVGWAVGLMETLGAPGAGLAVALENLFPPLPSEVILPLAGFTVSQGDMGLISTIVWTTIGSIAGALILYWVGATFGHRRTVAIAARIPLIRTSDIERTEAWFDRHGTKAVLIGRVIPIFRSLISIPAGIKRMPLGTFLGLTAAGSFVWNVLLILAGYTLGENWHRVEQYVGSATRAVLLAVVLAVGYFVGSRLVRSVFPRNPRTGRRSGAFRK
jgi:membrane protein DedA with SNARE-associated domain